jgi:hypothetical protein
MYLSCWPTTLMLLERSEVRTLTDICQKWAARRQRGVLQGGCTIAVSLKLFFLFFFWQTTPIDAWCFLCLVWLFGETISGLRFLGFWFLVDFDSIIFGAGRLWFCFQDQKTGERRRRRRRRRTRVGVWCGCGDEDNGLARPTGNEIRQYPEAFVSSSGLFGRLLNTGL